MYVNVNGFIPDYDTAKNPSFDKFRPTFAVRASADSGEHIIPEFTPISNQGAWPSCTMNAVLDTAEALIGLDNPAKVVQLSRMAGWWLTRQREGTQKSIIGVRLPNAFRVAEDIGACPEDVWPYDPPSGTHPIDWVLKKPKLSALEIMSDNKLTGWAQIFEVDKALLDATDFALYANHPVVYGTAIDEPFRLYGHDQVLYPPENPDNIIGRHAIAVFGRRVRNGRRQYWIRNSWGRSWGIRGHVWVDQSYLTWSEAMNHTVGTRASEIIR